MMSKKHSWRSAWSDGTVFVVTALVLIVLQILVILLSWILNAAVPDLGVRSLLSGEGLRLMLASYLDNISGVVLGGIVLVSIGCGSLAKSGLLSAVVHRRDLDFRHRFAFQLSMVEMVLGIAVALFVIFMPHSPMMSITGHFFPGPLLYSLIPYITIIMLLMAYSYSLFSGDLVALSQASTIVTYGLKKSAGFIVMYLIVMELIATISFVNLF